MNRQTTSMTDPLTPEQREVVERIRRGPHNKYTSFERIHDLISVIDSLPAPKKYTEAQLREGFESWVKKNWPADLHKKALKREGAGYHSSTVNDHWTGWINGARFTNSIKEPNA